MIKRLIIVLLIAAGIVFIPYLIGMLEIFGNLRSIGYWLYGVSVIVIFIVSVFLIFVMIEIIGDVFNWVKNGN